MMLDDTPRLRTHVEDARYLGCERADRRLGIQKMPMGYALMLNPDRTHFYWLCENGSHSVLDWDKWSVYRGAVEHDKARPRCHCGEVFEDGNVSRDCPECGKTGCQYCTHQHDTDTCCCHAE